MHLEPTLNVLTSALLSNQGKHTLIRDWSKSIGEGGGGGPEQRGGGSSVFEPLVRGGSCNFYLPVGGGSSCFYYGN